MDSARAENVVSLQGIRAGRLEPCIFALFFNASLFASFLPAFSPRTTSQLSDVTGFVFSMAMFSFLSNFYLKRSTGCYRTTGNDSATTCEGG
jgi:hypothetical protein